MESISLDAMLEAVEKYMGEQFTDMLVGAIKHREMLGHEVGYHSGRADAIYGDMPFHSSDSVYDW